MSNETTQELIDRMERLTADTYSIEDFWVFMLAKLVKRPEVEITLNSGRKIVGKVLESKRGLVRLQEADFTTSITFITFLHVSSIECISYSCLED